MPTLIRWFLLSGCLAGAVSAADQAAGGERQVAVVIVPTDAASERAAAILSITARRILARQAGLALVDVREKLLSGVEDAERTAFRQANKLLVEGRNQYVNLELDSAVKNLSAALELLEKAPARMGAGEDYLQALLYLGATRIIAGEQEAGVEAFRKALLYDPQRVMDKLVFPPSLVEIFEEVRGQVARLPTYSLSVESIPSGAEVFLDGVFQGVTPLVVSKVREGPHFFRLEKDGFRPHGELRLVNTNDTLLKVELRPVPAAKEWERCRAVALGDLDRDPPSDSLVKVSTWLGARMLVVGRVTKLGEAASVEAALINTSPPGKLSYQRQTLDRPAQSEAFFSSLLKIR